MMHKLSILLLLLTLAVACQPLIQPVADREPPAMQTVRYTPSTEDVPNPERGFHRNVELTHAAGLPVQPRPLKSPPASPPTPPKVAMISFSISLIRNRRSTTRLPMPSG